MFHTSMVMTDDKKELDSIQNEKVLWYKVCSLPRLQQDLKCTRILDWLMASDYQLRTALLKILNIEAY